MAEVSKIKHTEPLEMKRSCFDPTDLLKPRNRSKINLEYHHPLNHQKWGGTSGYVIYIFGGRGGPWKM